MAIRDSLPTPQPEVASGIKEQILKIPRGDRKQVVIDSINAFYFPDLKSVLASPPPQGWTTFAPSPENAGGTPPSPPQNVDTSALGPKPMRGFILTIVCTTPNHGGYSFVSQTFVDALQKLGYSPNRDFAVTHAQVVHAMKLSKLPNRLSAISQAQQSLTNNQTQAATPTGENSNSPPAGVSAGNPANTYLDRLTGEDVTQDTEVQIAVAVELDPTPPPKSANPTVSAQP
jgi:hypothetical protein